MKIDMSKVSKKSKMIAATAFVLGVTAAGAGVTYAATTPISKKGDHMDVLISAIAQKFNLNSSELESVIQDVMEQEHKNMEERREEKFIARLTQALIDGTLTQSQVDLITSKETEVKALMEDMMEKTPKERRAALKTNVEALKTWAKENDIPLKYLMPEMMGRKGKGPGPKYDELPEDSI